MNCGIFGEVHDFSDSTFWFKDSVSVGRNRALALLLFITDLQQSKLQLEQEHVDTFLSFGMRMEKKKNRHQ